MSSHTCHFCEHEQRATVQEKYPCGQRLVIIRDVETCCLCHGTRIAWAASVIRKADEPDAYSTDHPVAAEDIGEETQ